MRDALAIFGAWCAVSYAVGLVLLVAVELFRRHR